MFTALVSDRKGVWSQKLCTNYLLVELCTFPPVPAVYGHSVIVLEGMCNVLICTKRMHRSGTNGSRESKGQPANSGSPGMAS